MKPTEYELLPGGEDGEGLLERLEAQGAEIVFPGEVPSWHRCHDCDNCGAPNGACLQAVHDNGYPCFGACHVMDTHGVLVKDGDSLPGDADLIPETTVEQIRAEVQRMFDAERDAVSKAAQGGLETSELLHDYASTSLDRLRDFIDSLLSSDRESSEWVTAYEQRGLWACEDCGFAFADEHHDDGKPGEYTCPECETIRMRPVIEAAQNWLHAPGDDSWRDLHNAVRAYENTVSEDSEGMTSKFTADRMQLMADLLRRVTLDELGGRPDLFWPDCGHNHRHEDDDPWECWDRQAQAALARLDNVEVRPIGHGSEGEE